MKSTCRRLLLISLALAAALVAACGAKSSGDVKDTLDKAFSTPIKSARIDLEVSLTLDGVQRLNGPVKLSVQGPYESGGSKTIPQADWDIAASAAGQNFTAGFISTGDNAWVGFQGQNYEVGKAAVARINRQIQQAAGTNKNKGLSQFGIDPRAWIKDAQDEGSAKVEGVETDHVSATLDVGELLDDLNKLVRKAGNGVSGAQRVQISPSQKEEIEDAVEDPRFDVYVGKDDSVIRRLSADLSFKVPSDKQAQLNGLKSGTLSFSLDFTEVGQPQTINAPQNAKPLSELTTQLGGLGGALGGLGGASSGSGSSSSGSSGPTSAQLQKYSKCLQNANPSKPAELQKCADLLK
jgi:hypothetical protein